MIPKRKGDNTLTRSDVIEGYRRYLGREPESEVVIRQHMGLGTIDKLKNMLAASKEYLSKVTDIEIDATSLDNFVEHSDNLGGPQAADTIEYWKKIRYKPAAHVNESLDAYSDEYARQQIALYEEISGRELDQHKNEFTPFDIQVHVEAINPYGHWTPSDLALHLLRLSRALQLGKFARGEHVLDIGCGWGLSSELFAYSGLTVTALDINPAFVELVNKRALRSGLPIRAVQGTFEDIPGQEVFDAALYYECLHHAVRPWEALRSLHPRLSDQGRVIMAGEPFNDRWRSWGLRTDPLSLYCIRKHGWFESGWSPGFLQGCLARTGFRVEHCADEGGSIGWIVVARKA